MILASVSSHAPSVVATSIAENQVQYRNSQKILNDKIKAEAEEASKTVTTASKASSDPEVSSESSHSIDVRM